MEACAKERRIEHGVPRRGYVLSTVVEEIAGPSRTVVAGLRKAFAKSPEHIAPLLNTVGSGCFERAAWLSVSAWLLANISGRFASSPTLEESLSWFIGRPHTESECDFWQVQDTWHRRALEGVAKKPGLHALLPYILESHGPGSRLSVRRDPSTMKARTTKKAAGVFYTPSDVAAFMAREAIRSAKQSDTIKVLDPAVGTGVFLRAALAELRLRSPAENGFQMARRSLFGCDIDAVALDGAASVLLADTLNDALTIMGSPLAAWQALRDRLKQFDTLLIDREMRSPERSDRMHLDVLFPECSDGFDVVLGNPPYAAIGARRDVAELTARFATIAAKPRPTADLYPVFIEQMMQLAARSASGAMVVPLSLACNTGSQFAACRSLMEQQPGTWRFSFFDRQPHALFGEDVKTRNAILFWRRGRTATRIETGPLRKWRGDDRAAMLQRIDFTPIQGSIRSGIPKLHGVDQAKVWECVQREPICLGHLVSSWGRTTLDQAPGGAASDVYVSPTAYNFLGVSRPCPLKAANGDALSTHPLMRLSGETAEDAAAAFAVLSSRFAFWWWSVVGDGFHVNQGNLSRLPIGRSALAGSVHKRLAALGDAIWNQVRKHPVRSVNRGRVSYTFSAAHADALRRDVDCLLLESLGLDESFADELHHFTNCIAEARLLPPAKRTTRGKSSMTKKIPQEIKDKSILTKDEWREYTKTVWSIANKARPDHPAVFPEEIPHRLTKLFSFYGESVLDPFAGTGTTARAAIPLGRRAICVEQNPEYVNIIQSECAKLRNGHADDFVPLEAVEGDSRNMSFLPDDSVGLVVTSPPYWDKADYGEGGNNLGNITNYREFLDGIRPVFQECYRVLAPGRKICLVTANVNQHTDKGLLTFPLATDFAVLLRSLGFVMINEIIWSKDGTGGKWGSFGAQRPIFGSYPYPPNFLFKNVHEYVLIFAKPALTKTKGPKVKPYSDLMDGIDQMVPFVPMEDSDDRRLPMVEM